MEIKPRSPAAVTGETSRGPTASVCHLAPGRMKYSDPLRKGKDAWKFVAKAGRAFKVWASVDKVAS